MNQPVSNSTRRMTGGQALAEMLKLSNVGPMFGMGGFQLLPFYEACRALKLKHYLINDERCGAFAADAYAKVTNRPAVADGTLGPGATNLVTGLVESLNAGIPMIVVTGDANREHAWKNMTQEARQLEVLRPVVKEVIRVEVIKRLPEHVRRAFAVATSGRPGPVLIDVPEDVAHGEHDFDASDFWVDPGTLKAQARRTRPDRCRCDERCRADRQGGAAADPGRRRHSHLGGLWRAAGAWPRPTTFPSRIRCRARARSPARMPLSAGLFGRYDRIANALIAASDCLIVVGCKLGEIATKRFALIPPGKPIIHIEIEPTEIGRTTRTDVALVGRRAPDAASARGGAWRRQGGGAPAGRLRGGASQAHGGVARGRGRPTGVARNADQCRPPDGRAQQDHAGRRHRRGGRRLRGPLGRTDVRHQAGGPALPARSRLRLDRLRRAGRHRRADRRRTEAARGQPDRRRRLQHEPRASSRRRAAWAPTSSWSSSTMPPPAT